MAYASTVPAAITGLLAALRAWPALEGVEVHDGPRVSESKALEVIAVGFAGERMSRTGAYPEPSQPEADVTVTVEGASVTPAREQYPVRCMLAVLNGGKDVTAARERAYTLLSATGAAVTADPKLGGAVMLATLGNHALTQEQATRGALATITFEVNCDAWTGR